jgi:hypothetical protein
MPCGQAPDVANAQSGLRLLPTTSKCNSTASEDGCMRSQEYGSFFSLVAGSGAGENYFSRLFQACFAADCAGTIWKACASPKAVPRADNWVCDYQPSTWVSGGGRPDLCLRPGQAANVSKHIVLESKLGSRLTESNLGITRITEPKF